MYLLPEQEIEGDNILDTFISDDGKHEVVWMRPEDLDYSLWYCVIHEKNYYLGCVSPKS